MGIHDRWASEEDWVPELKHPDGRRISSDGRVILADGIETTVEALLEAKNKDGEADERS